MRHLSTYLLVYLSTRLHIYLSTVYLSICLPVYMSTCLRFLTFKAFKFKSRSVHYCARCGRVKEICLLCLQESGELWRHLSTCLPVHLSSRLLVYLSVRISLTLEVSEMFLSRHMIFSLERAAFVWAILERISGFDPSLEVVVPRYLKFSTASSLSPFILISLWMPFGLFVITFVLSGPISIPNASYMILSRKMLNMVGESRHPCWTPTVVLRTSPLCCRWTRLHSGPFHIDSFIYIHVKKRIMQYSGLVCYYRKFCVMIFLSFFSHWQMSLAKE